MATTTTPTLPDQAAKLLGPLSGTATVWGLELAVRLGIVEHLAEHPEGVSAAEVSADLGLDPEYTHVILRSAYAAEVLDRDGDRYRLADHMATLLLDEDHPAFLGGALQVFVALRESFLDLREFARTGEREWWSDFDHEWINAVGTHCQAYYRRLIGGVMPQLPDVQARLESGARFLDLACGTCRGPAKVVGAYPKTVVTAVDADAYSLEVAEREMKERGIRDRFTFVESYLETLDLDGGHDVAHINVSLHEARDIEAAVAERASCPRSGRHLPHLGVPLPRARGRLPDRPRADHVRRPVLRGAHRLPAPARSPLRRLPGGCGFPRRRGHGREPHARGHPRHEVAPATPRLTGATWMARADPIMARHSRPRARHRLVADARRRTRHREGPVGQVVVTRWSD